MYRKLHCAFHDFSSLIKDTGYYVKVFFLSDRCVINLFAESSNKQYIFHDRFCISRYPVLNIACTACLISCKHECASSHVIEWYFMHMILIKILRNEVNISCHDLKIEDPLIGIIERIIYCDNYFDELLF